MRYATEELHPGMMIKHNRKLYMISSVPKSWDESMYIRVVGRGYHKALHPNVIELMGIKGKKSVPIHDKLTEELRGKPLDELYNIAAARLNCSVVELHDKYSHLNNGLQAMSLRNRIRGVKK